MGSLCICVNLIIVHSDYEISYSLGSLLKIEKLSEHILKESTVICTYIFKLLP